MQNLDEIAAILKNGLGEAAEVHVARSYVAVLHKEMGLAAVVPSQSETEAEMAAADLTTKAVRAGAAWNAFPFAVSSDGVKPPVIVRSGPNMVVDIVAVMARKAGTRPPLDENALKRIGEELEAEKSKVKPHRPLHPEFLRMAKACVEKALAGRPVFLLGREIGVRDIVSPAFMLPCLLVTAAQAWSLPVVASYGEGGFLVRMVPDKSAVPLFRVVSVDMSAPELLFLPMTNIIRRSISYDECILDDVYLRFSEFMAKSGFMDGEMEDMDVRIASVS